MADSALRVSLEQDPTPLVEAMGADLRRRLSEASFVELTEGLRGTVGLRAATTPEAITIVLGEERIALRHGATTGPDLSAVIDGEGRLRAEEPIEGEADHPRLARWVTALLDGPGIPWRESAARFWAVLEAMPGAPPALLVVDAETGERERFGAGERAYEIHGRADRLAALLEGRSSLLEEAGEGRILIRGSFPEISVLTGAAFAVRSGCTTDA